MPDKMSLSIDGENLAFTMQAEVGQMTMEEAIASGLFDLPDESDMVRIPVSLNVWLPNSILYPPAPPPEPSPTDSTLGVPPGGARRTHFGNYPNAIAAQNIARTFQSPPEAQAERDRFHALVGVLQPPRGPRAPDGTPIQLVQDEEPETQRGPDGRELSPLEAARQDSYNSALRSLRALEPGYSELTQPG